MYTQRIKLAITKCIIIGDPRRLENKQEPLRTKWGLCKELEALNPDKYKADNLSVKLHTLQKSGQKRVDRYLIADICHLLHVSSDELHDI